MVGLYEIEKMLNTKVYLGNHLLEYTIVGITDLESPSIYANNNQFINIIDNSSSDSMFSYGNEKMGGGSVFDYSLYKDKISIKKGRTPDNDYEVIVNENLKDSFKLDKYIDDLKVNGNKLKVVGYYTSSDEINSYFVNSNTNKYELKIVKI